MPLEGAAFYNALARKGEAQVRLELATGIYNERRAKIVSEWLHQRELERAAQVDRRRDERDEEALALTREALRTAQEANRISAENATAARSSARSACVQARWAVWAAVVAVVAAAVAAKDDLLRLFQALL